MSSVVSLDLQFSQSFFRHDPQQIRKDDLPLFLAADGIHGVVNVNYSGNDFASRSTDFIKICLYGWLTIRVPSLDGSTSSTCKQRILNVVDILPLRPGPGSTASTSSVPVLFDLTLPKTVSYTTESHDSSRYDWSRLPSSISVGTNVAMNPSMPPGTGQKLDAQVWYTLCVQAIRDGKVIGNTSRRVRVFDNGEAQPPTCTADFSPEYLCQQSRALRKHVLTNVGVLFVAAAEPMPFMFCLGRDFASTQLPIQFTIARPQVENGKKTRCGVDELDTSVIWRLRTSTFMSTTPMDSIPTVRQARRPSPVSMITSLGLKHPLKLTLRNWKRAPANGSAIQSLPESWTHTADLTLSIPKRVLVVPTFSTPYLTRRYSLLLQIRVAGAVGAAKLTLEVPVQVVYRDEAGAGCAAERPGHSRGRADCDLSGEGLEVNPMDVLPIYVP